MSALFARVKIWSFRMSTEQRRRTSNISGLQRREDLHDLPSAAAGMQSE